MSKFKKEWLHLLFMVDKMLFVLYYVCFKNNKTKFYYRRDLVFFTKQNKKKCAYVSIGIGFG